MSSIEFPLSGDLVRFASGQRLERKIVGLGSTVGIDRVYYTMMGDFSYNDTVEFTDHTWLSYSPWYGWRYFYPTGPTLGVPVLVTEQGFAQPGYWRNFVEYLASTLAGAPRRFGTLLLCLFLALASCASSRERETKHQVPAYNRRARVEAEPANPTYLSHRHRATDWCSDKACQ